MENCVDFGVYVLAITYMLTHSKAYMSVYINRPKKAYVEESAKVRYIDTDIYI